MKRSHQLHLILAFVVTSTLTSCMVGPNFHAPNAPQTQSYTGTALPKKTIKADKSRAGKTQYFISGADIPAQWWTLFHSHELNNLIMQGIANSPNLDAAKAALRAAHQATVAQFGSTLLPSVSATVGGERERFSAATVGDARNTNSSIFNLYNASVNVSYTLDVFGGARRQLETIAAQEDNARYELAAAYLTLTSNITTTAITIASLRSQIQATNELIKAQLNQLDIVSKQFKLGGAAKSDVLTQQTLLAQTRATLPPLEQSLAQNLHLLSVLIGDTPHEDQLPHFDLDKINLPNRLPVSLPSKLVRQRPDILAAEASLHAASAQIGVATANMLPQFTLTGAYGWEGTNFARLIDPHNLVWNYGTSVLQQVFNGGALVAKRNAAIDLFQQSAAQYRQTVLQAFQNVADTLRALQHDARELKIQQEGLRAARESLAMTEKQYFYGGVNYVALLIVERQYQQAKISYVQAQAARYSDTAALFQALGGGWWNNSFKKEVEG